MASLSEPMQGYEPAEGLECRPAAPADRRRVLGLLLTGRTAAAGHAVDQFLLYAREHQIDFDHLWAAYDADRPLAAALIVPSAGRTAMAFVSPLVDSHLAKPTSVLLRAVCRSQDPARVRLIQSLLEPGQEPEAQALTDAGFTRLAHLVYMQCRIDHDDTPLAPDPQVRILRWSADNHAAYRRAILASYQDTLDCPGLLGLREIDDIIAGHMATGQFVPELWHALYAADQPVAVMCLNVLPQRHAMELVYLGVTSPWRRRGLAQQLMRHAFGLAYARRCANMVLAVDEHNTPALKLYRALGFVATARKTAMILTLPMNV